MAGGLHFARNDDVRNNIACPLQAGKDNEEQSVNLIANHCPNLSPVWGNKKGALTDCFIPCNEINQSYLVLPFFIWIGNFTRIEELYTEEIQLSKK